MAAVKKPASKSAWAAAAPKATVNEKAHFLAVLEAMAPLEKSPAKKAANPDHARIKKMYAKLAKEALGAITASSLGSVRASDYLRLYAELHAGWLEATEEALSKKTAVAARKADARFKKLEKLHNNFIVSGVDDAQGDILAKLKKLSLSGRPANDAAFQKLSAERDAAREKALKASGIGERKIYNF
jgi:hypothetical protein